MRVPIYKGVLQLETQQTEYVKERNMNVPEITNLFTPGNVAEMMRVVFELDRSPVEQVYLICQNSKGIPIAVSLLTQGTVNSSVFCSREVFLQALKLSAVSIILCHNHPSQDVTPSRDDIIVTNKLKDAGHLLGIKVLDHVIVAHDTYFSFKEQDYL